MLSFYESFEEFKAPRYVFKAVGLGIVVFDYEPFHFHRLRGADDRYQVAGAFAESFRMAVNTVLHMKMDYLIHICEQEFIIVNSRVIAPVGVYLKVAVASYHVDRQALVAHGLEFLGMIVIIGGYAVFFHRVITGSAEHFARLDAFLLSRMGSAAYAYGFRAELMLEFDGFFKPVRLKIIQTDMPAHADQTELIELRADCLGRGSEIACEFNAVIAYLFYLFIMLTPRFR